jgi:hypothetical protein
VAADPFLHISPADEQVIVSGGPRRCGASPKRLRAKAVMLANAKDQKREKEIEEGLIDPGRRLGSRTDRGDELGS